MNGAEALVRTLLANGVDTCFANPGTSEIHLLAAIDTIPEVRCVLGLFEGVVTGAADGYSRMTGKPAMTVMHHGPGLANGLANLHNARRAQSSTINLVGDAATYFRKYDSPLTADIEGWARPVSSFVRTSRCSREISADGLAAVQAARTAPGGIASLILPSDACWGEGAEPLPEAPPPAPGMADPSTLRAVAKLLRSGERCLLLLGTHALRGAPLDCAQAIAVETGCAVMAPQANGRAERGRGRYPIRRLATPVDQVIAQLEGFQHIILVGAPPPVAFFAYPDKPHRIMADGTQVHVLARLEQDPAAALAALADELGARPVRTAMTDSRADAATGAIDPDSFGQSLTALLPENAIVVDESVTFGRSLFARMAEAAPHDWLQLTGGAIGAGLPIAVGAAIAAPDRRVVALDGDGSAMYSAQALWTHAREQLDITTVILSNRRYQILHNELAAVTKTPGRVALDALSLTNPDIDWVKLAQSMGVEAASASSMEQFNDLFQSANRRRGPFLIELEC